MVLPTFLGWVQTVEELSDHYARSRMTGLDVLADELQDIADDSGGDAVAVNHARLRVDTRKWVLSKLVPKKYGDRIAVDADVKVSVNYEQILAEATALGLTESDVFGG